MTGTFIQPALMSANNAKANLNGSVGSGANGKSVGENSLFAGTLENILAKDVKLGTKVPPDLAKLLEKLVSALKQLPQASSSTGKTETEKVVKLLKEVVAALQHHKEGVDAKEGNLEVLIQAAEQLQHLLVSLPPKSEGTHATQQMKSGKETMQLAEAINRLLEKMQVLFQNSSVTKEAQPGSNKPAQFQAAFLKVTDKEPRQVRKGHLKQSSVPLLQQQGQTESHRGSTVQPSSLAADPKSIAASAFRRLGVQQDKANIPAQVGGFDPASGTMHRLQQFVLHVRQEGKMANQQQFIRDFQQILAKSKLTSFGGKQQITLRLHPQHLGKLNIQLTHENGQLTARLMASTSAAKNLVEAHLPQLQGAFASQNLNVQKLQVQVLLPYGDATPQQGYGEGGEQDEPQEHQSEAENHADDDGAAEMSFSEWLDDLQPNWMQEVRL